MVFLMGVSEQQAKKLQEENASLKEEIKRLEAGKTTPENATQRQAAAGEADDLDISLAVVASGA